MRAAAVAAGALLLVALILYAVGLIAGLDANCATGERIVEGKDPGAATVDKSLSYWPPGQNCDYVRGGDKVSQPLAWIDEAIIGVGALAVLMLVLGLFSAVRYRRRRGDEPAATERGPRTQP
jgi:hypothetical protein